MQIHRIKSLSEYHRILGLPKPEHPLISVLDIASLNPPVLEGPISLVFDFYTISVKRDLNKKLKYGQLSQDFDEGVMFFTAPGQVWGLEMEKDSKKTPSGWMILIHPDFLWNTSLAKTIKKYEFFSYSVNEALYLSDKEESMITAIAKLIELEYHNTIDKFSQNVIIAQLELLLTYSERFYQRQFLTRKISNHQILNQLEEILDEYFNSDTLAKKGIPSVAFLASALSLSPNYLSELLKVLTGQNTQQHIHNKLIEKAKEHLSTSELTISEIAYELGFEHLQSFSKLFKAKTNLTPLQFRHSFN
jgi:AraC-like DNA-binding protein